MRLIDADALHEALKTKQKWVVRCGDKHNEGYTYDQVHFAIDDAPSIDICFCKDCSYRNEINCPQYYRRTELRDGDFCSYGERKEGE